MDCVTYPLLYLVRLGWVIYVLLLRFWSSSDGFLIESCEDGGDVAEKTMYLFFLLCYCCYLWRWCFIGDEVWPPYFLQLLESLLNTRFLYYPFGSSCRCQLCILTPLFDFLSFSFFPFRCHPIIKSLWTVPIYRWRFDWLLDMKFFARRWEDDVLQRTMFSLSTVFYPLACLWCGCFRQIFPKSTITCTRSYGLSDHCLRQSRLILRT